MLMAVVGEFGIDQVDPFRRGLRREGGWFTLHDWAARSKTTPRSTRYLVPGSDDLEAGKAFFEITVFGDDTPIYRAYLRRPLSNRREHHAMRTMSKMIQAISKASRRSCSAKKNPLRCARGTVVQKVDISTMRGRMPWKLAKTVPQLRVFLFDVRIAPKQDPSRRRENKLHPLIVNTVSKARSGAFYVFRTWVLG